MHADVLAPAHRETLEALAAFAGDVDEAARLRHLTSPEGKAEYQSWVAAPSRSLLELLQAFPSVRPSLGAVLALIPVLLEPLVLLGHMRCMLTSNEVVLGHFCFHSFDCC